MAREKEGYRDILARVDAAFPNKEILTLAEVMAYTGMGRKKLMNRYGSYFAGGNKKNERKTISKVALARALCV